jgi:protocatechuate 3,4-dioxygenase beta subunit
VTTATTEYRLNGQPGSAERVVLIGGTVFDPTGIALADAWVHLETPAGTPLTDTVTDALGHFTFPAIREDHYQIRTRAAGFGEKTRLIDVPALDGEYDVHFP